MEHENSVIKFHHPTNILFAGATRTGKTQLAKDILLNLDVLFDKSISKIWYIYTCWQDAFDELNDVLKSKIDFRVDIPDLTELSEPWDNDKKHSIIILDDKLKLLGDSEKGKQIAELICVHSHHKNISCFILVQNLYHQSKCMREIALNCPITILFKNDRGVGQLRTFASQVLPGQSKYFIDSYNKATSEPYTYLVTDFSTGTDKKFRLRSGILPDEITRIFLPV
jgi:hypothetical protein